MTDDGEKSAGWPTAQILRNDTAPGRKTEDGWELTRASRFVLPVPPPSVAATSIVDLDDVGFEFLEIQDRYGATIGHPAAAFAGV